MPERLRGHGERGLGQSVGRAQRIRTQTERLEHLGEALDHPGPDLLGADEERAHRREVRFAAPAPPPARDELERERRRDRDRHLQLAEELDPPARAAQEALGRPLVQRAADPERVDHRADEPHVVEQRQPGEAAVRLGERPLLADARRFASTAACEITMPFG